MTHANGGSHHAGNHHSGHSVHSASQSGHHNLNIGNLSNGNMLGGNYQYWNLANFMEGLKVNTGIRFAVLFIAFAGWLYVIYWIRHHEPFINQMIGTQTSLAPTAAQDKSMVAAIRNVFPWRTSPSMGELYVPSPEVKKDSREITKMSPTPSYVENRMIFGPGQAISAPLESTRPNFDDRFGSPVNEQVNYTQNGNSFMEPINPNSASFGFSNGSNIDPNFAYQQNYQIQVKPRPNDLLRTVVTR